jgi:hypothetical protein
VIVAVNEVTELTDFLWWPTIYLHKNLRAPILLRITLLNISPGWQSMGVSALNWIELT